MSIICYNLNASYTKLECAQCLQHDRPAEHAHPIHALTDAGFTFCWQHLHDAGSALCNRISRCAVKSPPQAYCTVIPGRSGA